MLDRKLSSDAIIYGISQIIERGMSFFLLPILAKIVSVSEYAIWSQSVVVAGVLTPVLLLGFQTALIKYWPSWDRVNRQDSMMLTMLGGILLMMAVTAAILIVFDDQIAGFIYGAPDYAQYIPILIGMMVTEALFEFMVGVLRANGLIKKISLYVIVKGGFRVLVFLSMLHLVGVGFQIAFTGFVSIQLLLIIVIYGQNISWGGLIGIRLSGSKKEWVDILKFSMPLVMLGLLIGVNNFTDRFFLTYLYGLRDVAAYSAAYSLVAIITFIYSVLGFVLFPVLSRHVAEGNNRTAGRIISQALLIYLFFLIPFAVGVAFVGPDLIQLLTTNVYRLPWYVFLLMSGSIGFFGLYQISFYVILLKYGSMPSLSLMAIVAVVNIILNLVLVPRMGGGGAALAGFLSNGMLAIITFRVALQAVPWAFEWKHWLRIIFQVILMSIVLWLGKFWFGFSNPVALIGIILFSIALYLSSDCIHNQSSVIKLLRKS